MNYRHLVSEAQPIKWERLSQKEQELILTFADPWMSDVLQDSAQAKSPPDATDPKRTGRVLFIDGPRGAGKTSLLLTLLRRWDRDVAISANTPLQAYAPFRRDLHILRPILDFDPLPRGMPLHGWLLEPWRKEARRAEASQAVGARDAVDLVERFADLFERAVTGWTEASVEGKGVVEKAIGYQEQASGWLDTRRIWHEFIGELLCRDSQCGKPKCDGAHGRVYIVAIDDIDLQVEHVPRLLHAIRLFHHPNVAYVLTGNYNHLFFALTLDYTYRHTSRLRGHHLGEVHLDPTLRESVSKFSDELAQAFIEKALPSHARLKLPRLTIDTVLGMHADEANPIKRDGPVGRALESARELLFVTARQAQHAIDRFLARTDEGEPALAEMRLLADLCGTHVKLRKPRTQFELRGRLTTKFGATFRAWEGDRLTIALSERPHFVFAPDFDENRAQHGEDAHRAVVVQLLSDADLADALGLTWTPDAGVVSTEVRWRSSIPRIDGRAVFRWPWFKRPSAAQALGLQSVAEAMDATVQGNSASDLPMAMVAVWIQANIKSFGSPGSQEPDDDTALAAILKLLKSTYLGADEKDRIELERWICELAVMTAPYFGLPLKAATQLRDALIKEFSRKHDDAPLLSSVAAVQAEERRMIRNAIILGQRTFERSGSVTLTSEGLDDSVREFRATRNEVARNDPWWRWLDGPGESRGGPPASDAAGDQAAPAGASFPMKAARPKKDPPGKMGIATAAALATSSATPTRKAARRSSAAAVTPKAAGRLKASDKASASSPALPSPAATPAAVDTSMRVPRQRRRT